MTDSRRGIGHVQTKPMTRDNVMQTFDQLIKAWQEIQAAEDKLREFNKDHPEPELLGGRVVELGVLAEYNLRREQRARHLAKLSEQKSEKELKFGKLVEVVKELLPEGRTVHHEYGGSTSGLQGRYTVAHVPSRQESAPRRKVPSEVIVRSGIAQEFS